VDVKRCSINQLLRVVYSCYQLLASVVVACNCDFEKLKVERTI